MVRLGGEDLPVQRERLSGPARLMECERLLQNRRDGRNQRAATVDAWRQIAVTADDLESGLDVVFSGDI
ncbi:MAG: hypothetical protein IH906_06250, partial [Proteobacteria bacterium]|nr:hypothetical protein [Pseudomonadota bacterium]